MTGNITTNQSSDFISPDPPSQRTLNNHKELPVIPTPACSVPVHDFKEPIVDNAFRGLYQSVIPALDATIFEHIEGKRYELHSKPIWTEPLGKKLCFVDIDNRWINGSNELLSSGPFPWADFQPQKAGVMNHYLYCITKMNPSIKRKIMLMIPSSYSRVLLPLHSRKRL